MRCKMNFRKIPFWNKIYKKFDGIENEINNLCTENINLRIKLKVLNREKINIVFLCHRPAVWGAQKTIYEAFLSDSRFDTKIVTLPQIDDMASYGKTKEYFSKYNAINGYDEKACTYINLKELLPDIVFYQQPYDSMRHNDFSSNVVSKYSKICYVTYFSFISNVNNTEVIDSCYPKAFFKNVDFIFAQDKFEEGYLQQYLDSINSSKLNIVNWGYPKYDNLDRYINSESVVWNYKKDDDIFRVLWTPRWTTNENNCHFFKYKDKLMDFCDNNTDVDFVFRPHPQSWIEWEKTGEFSSHKKVEFYNEYEKRKNMSIDETGEYLTSFYSSNCLLTDTSSIVLEYFLTGNPIIYCYNNSVYDFTKEGIGEGFYWAESWDDVYKYLIDLKNGIDPLKNKRMELIKNNFNISDTIPSGEKIKNYLADIIGF